MTVATEVHAEIRRLRERVPAVTGSLVATLDGLLIAQDMTGVEPEGVAALAAAGLGLGQRIGATVRQGDMQEMVIHNAGGYVATCTAGPRALLVALAPASAHLERLMIEARLAADRVAAIVDVLDVIDFGDLDPGAAAVVQPSDGYGVPATDVGSSRPGEQPSRPGELPTRTPSGLPTRTPSGLPTRTPGGLPQRRRPPASPAI